MTLLILSVDALPHVGGISLMSHHLANAWAIRHDVVFAGPAGSYVPDDLSRSYRFLEDRESNVRERSGRTGLIQDERIRDLVARTIERYRISRVLLMHPFYYGVGVLDACAGEIPVSLYIHGFELRSQLQDGYPSNHRQLLRERRIGTLRERLFHTIGRVDEILVNSRYTASLLDGFQVKPTVRVTGCGIPQSELARELAATPVYRRAERMERRRARSAGPHLGYVGRLVPTKGIERILRLCRSIPGATATIVGTGPAEAELRNAARRLRVEDRVAFTGAASESAKWDALRGADFLCLLSEPNDRSGQVEGFGIALLEGAAAGAVPVSSGTGGMKDVVAHRSTGLVLPRDDGDAAALLSRTYEDEKQMADLVAGARRQLESSFNWSAIAAKIDEGWT